MRIKGKITKWNDDKGFGFITPNATGKQVFIHISAFNNRSRRPEINQEVTYSLTTDKNGRPRAEKATLPGDKLHKKGAFSLIIAVAFLFVTSFFAITGKIPLSLLVIYFAGSIITFIAYAIDKSAAQRGAWRTSESTLHLLSLVGGWPGAIFAQQKWKTWSVPDWLADWLAIGFKGGVNWAKFEKIRAAFPFPKPRICHNI